MNNSLRSLRFWQLAICVAVCAHNADQLVAQVETENRDDEKRITWTEIPEVDRTDPTLHRGIVFGPSGKPITGAQIYAASTIELFELHEADEVSVADLGDVRAVTDAAGRFEFHAPDLTWTPAPGQRKRWEALLVATKEGLVSGWVKTWGEDRSFRSHWHPHSTKKVEIHLSTLSELKGRFIDADGNPLGEAQVRVTSLMVPRGRDLDNHISLEETKPLGFLSSIDYEETFQRPWLLPKLTTEARTDDNGLFSLTGLPKDCIARLEVSHPLSETTNLRVAVRKMGPVYREPFGGQGTPTVSLLGSGFTRSLPAGITLKGRVTEGTGFGEGNPVEGATVALASHNSASGLYGPRFTTDVDGRFELSGLGKDYRGEGYEVAVVGSFHTPISAGRFSMRPGYESTLKVAKAIPYRITLTDEDGNPVDRKVYSIVVQQKPGQLINGVSSRFNHAKQVGPGVYEGILPVGPGAVLVKRGKKRDRPVLVQPKEYFEPGRTDWTAGETRYAYGSKWQITQPGVVMTRGMSPNLNVPHSQLDLAAVVFNREIPDELPLRISAVVKQDPPTEVMLVDENGEPVVGASMTRQLKRYNAENLPSTMELYGLHPDRAEFVQFHHEEKRLLGFVRATPSKQPYQVVMRSPVKLTGSLVRSDGTRSNDFGMIVTGAVPPDTFLANFVNDTILASEGRFALLVHPGETYSGKLIRKTDWKNRPSVGHAFGPVTPQAGETLELGDIVVP